MADRPGLLGTPLGQFGLGALALVVGGALLFSLIGAVSGPDSPEITDEPVATSTPTGGTTGTDAPTSDPTDPGTGDPTPAPTATEVSPTPTDTATTPVEVDADLAIQVLNGSDDAADHDAVVACLEAAGYGNLITSNRARSTYATTTVFYTAGEGNEASAQQVAQVLGTSDVEEQPGNLSESVPVHVVTGQDGAELC